MKQHGYNESHILIGLLGVFLILMSSCQSTKPAERPLPNGLDVISSRTGEPVEYNSMFGTNTVVQVPRNSQFVCYSHGSIAYVADGIVYDAKSHEPVTSSPAYGSEILKIPEGTRFFFPSGVTFFYVIDGKLYDVQSGERVEYRGFLSKSEAISVPEDSRFVFPLGETIAYVVGEKVYQIPDGKTVKAASIYGGKEIIIPLNAGTAFPLGETIAYVLGEKVYDAQSGEALKMGMMGSGEEIIIPKDSPFVFANSFVYYVGPPKSP